MKNILFTLFLILSAFATKAGSASYAASAADVTYAAGVESRTICSPDGKLQLKVEGKDGNVFYSVTYEGRQMLEQSALGILTNMGDFSEGLSITGFNEESVDYGEYNLRNAKTSTAHFTANYLGVDINNRKQQSMTIEFYVADNDIAFRYYIPKDKDTACAIVKGESTSFRLPEKTTTFITPQSDPMIGWMRTKPSYEEEYSTDAPMTNRSWYGHGYTFPCLFRVGEDGWVLISETGTDGNYTGCRISDYDPEKGYTIEYPMEGEANGYGTTTASLALPGYTPFRTITVGSSLKPIVETTIAYDVVKPKYEASEEYAPGRYTWSWLIWQDYSINYADQVEFIDLAGEMGYEYCLVDAAWDRNIGYENMKKLSEYAQSKGVRLLLWYNSNGSANDAPQSPKHKMDTNLERRKEMAWMKSAGIAGIKVDFFSGDKQHTMKLYEDILTDANDFGLQVIFHGCTLPRGWERMYPNFVSSEAVLASENVFFSDYHAKKEATHLTIHPFCRNAVASMDWGGTIMNKFLSRDNKSRHQRYTTDIFEMAAAIIIQTSIQCIAIQPNNLQELPQFEIDFLKSVPADWDETRFIDGYPGKYVVLARRHGDDWYVAGLNAESTEKKLTIVIPEMAGKTVSYYVDDARKGPQLRQLKVDKKGQAEVVIQPNGGIILLDNTSQM